MTVLTPPAALSKATFARPDPLWARLWAPRRPQRSLNFDVIFATLSHILGPATRMAPRLAPTAQSLSKMCRTTVSNGYKTDPK